MFRMEVDSSPESDAPSHYDLIVRRLLRMGIPEDNLNQGQRGLVDFVKNHRFHIDVLVPAILPSDKEVDEDVFRESMLWLQWLMFEGDPEAALEYLAKVSANQRGVCGAVWGNNELAYRCRTCEHDPTCAICVPCFENGNHEGHDYSIIYTDGGCCDCGDITAWKREGFCSLHKGAEQIRPLPDHVAKSLGPVLDILLSYWKDNLHYAKSVSEESPTVADNATELQKTADELTSAVVEMLLDFCKHSESLLSFVSGRVYSSSGLLDVLLMSERFMNDIVVVKLHELLLKLLGEPIFKYEFAKVFVVYYPSIVKEAITESSDTAFKKYPLLPTFSVQILTVPTLTQRLVEEMDLLGMLLQCLEYIFTSCAGEDGRLQVAKWANLYETTLRVVEDIRFVMSHSAVPKYLCHSRRDLVRTWMRLLTFVQGMNAQKRETGSHIEDENENVHFPFVLCHTISNILSLLVAGAYSASISEHTDDEAVFSTYKLKYEEQDSPRHAKVGRLSEESSVGSVTGRSTLDHGTKDVDFPIPSSALWLIYECLRFMENWLALDNTVGPLSPVSLKTSNGSGNNFLALKRTISRFRRGRYIFKSSTSSSNKPSMSSEALNKQFPSSSHGGLNIGSGSEYGLTMGQEAGSGNSDDNMLDGENTGKLEGLQILSMSDWPDISYDVSTQVISVHIPLHRLLSMVLLRALKECCGDSESSNVLTACSADRSFPRYSDFLGQILEGCHPYGFSAFVMEHPLRIRVFCAEVHAGMWRRNGDAPILFSEWYRSVRWSEQGQELDLFLLQCCAALAPPDFFVQRTLERFGLSDYLTLNLEQASEHEPILVAEMLTLIVQIVKERRFCGLTTVECLQRELVYKLAIGDATRSQLVKSLPRDLSKSNKLQEVLDTVAEFSRPSGMTQGMYKLRSSYWKDLDLYHPRWNSRDQQTAEERYLRFCNVSALTTQLPRWTKIYYPLRGLARIASCKTLLKIVRAVLFYAVFSEKLSTSRAPDDVLLTALHLLALSLDVCRVHKESGDPICYVVDVIPLLAFASEEIYTSRYGDQSMFSLLVLLMMMQEKENREYIMETGNFNLSSLVVNLIKTFVELEPGCMAKLQKLAPQLANQLSRSILIVNAKDNGPASDSEKRKAKSRERQAAIMEKMRAQQSKFLERVDSNADEEMNDTKSKQEISDTEIADDSSASTEVVCSLCHDPKSKNPVSFLVLLQKSRLLSFVGRDPPTWKQVERPDKEHVSDSTTASMDIFPSSSDGSVMNRSSQLEEIIQSALNEFSSIGQTREVSSFIEFVKARFPSVKDFQVPSMLNDTRERATASLETWEEDMYSLIRGFSSSFNNLVYKANVERISSAGRGMKRKGKSDSLLLGKYIAALPKEAPDRPSASQSSHSRGDKTQPESNTLHQVRYKFGPSGSDGIYISSCGHAVHQGCLDRYLSSLRERYIRRIVFEGGHIVDPDQGEFLCPVCRGLANSVLPALPGDMRKVHQRPADPTDANILPCLSDTQASLRLQDALSLLQRASDFSGSSECLNAIPTQNARIQPNLEPTVRLLCGMYYPGQDKIFDTGRVSHSLILWDTLKYSLMSAEISARSRKSSLRPNYSLGALYKKLKSSNGFILSLLLNVIQSTRTANSPTVLLRLRGMQLFARSLCYVSSQDAASHDNFREEGNMMYILKNAEERYPDIQLWRWATDPVLAHDAFSSLMWILFCLPRPVVSCKESYLSLVHVFYVVTVAQAIITYCKKNQHIETHLASGDSLIADIYQAMGGCVEVVECFDSHDVDPAYDINDSIRSLTFPYLRRCALLWKLVNCANSVPFSDGSADGLGCATDAVEELSQIEKLEKMFSIPPLGVILNDEKSRSAMFRWLGHFSEAFEARNQRVIRCAPAVPFQLILLPHLYQDLLRRYIRKSCPDCGAVKEEPALCLLCGKLCSPNWKPCCRESGCQTHATTCGAGIGVFLLIKRTTISLQRSARQAPWPSLYLDAFGEEDVEMHRGKPLFLNEERYAALTHMVASHGLDRSSKVLRQTTVGAFFMF